MAWGTKWRGGTNEDPHEKAQEGELLEPCLNCKPRAALAGSKGGDALAESQEMTSHDHVLRSTIRI